jgi:hypothetical protein
MTKKNKILLGVFSVWPLVYCVAINIVLRFSGAMPFNVNFIEAPNKTWQIFTSEVFYVHILAVTSVFMGNSIICWQRNNSANILVFLRLERKP